ncbi:MAG: hypothetical protein ACT4PE_12035 [Candidatus Eiseniibacteriota bacterium]
MSPFGRIGRFLIVALPLYAGCLLLWTPIAATWGDGYRFASEAVLGRFGPGVRVRFAPHPHPTKYVDTELVITSERAPDVEAVGESGSLSGTYLPSALLVSLVAGTRMPARRRLVGLAAGIVLVHIAALAITALALLDQLADEPQFRPFAVPGSLRPALATVAAAVRGHFYPMLAVTCGIWAAVTFGSPPSARPTPARAARRRAR